MIGSLFALGGAAAGMIQAGLLTRSARKGSSPVSIFARFLLVGTVFFLSARTGSLAFASVGWMAGFAAAGVVLQWRIR